MEFTLIVKWIFRLYQIILNNPYPVKIKPRHASGVLIISMLILVLGSPKIIKQIKGSQFDFPYDFIIKNTVKTYYNLKLFNSLNCFQRIFISTKSSKSEIPFPIRAESGTGGSDYISLF